MILILNLWLSLLQEVKFWFLFVICHHSLNSTRSPTTYLSRFTDGKELNPTPGGEEKGWGAEPPPRSEFYSNYRRIRAPHSDRVR